jgi:hypothetical protein
VTQGAPKDACHAREDAESMFASQLISRNEPLYADSDGLPFSRESGAVRNINSEELLIVARPQTSC